MKSQKQMRDSGLRVEQELAREFLLREDVSGDPPEHLTVWRLPRKTHRT